MIPRQSRGFVKQFQSRQVILPELFLYILLSHDKITHIDKLEFNGIFSLYQLFISPH